MPFAPPLSFSAEALRLGEAEQQANSKGEAEQQANSKGEAEQQADSKGNRPDFAGRDWEWIRAVAKMLLAEIENE